MNHLLLVDGSNYAFRAFHGMPLLYNSKGEPTSAIVGFINMLRGLQDKLKPSHMAVVFDPKGGTFRHKEYTPYKANRSAMPEELAQQWPHLVAVTQHLGMNMLCVDDFEADDVIATLTKKAEQQQWRVSIASSDKDLMQLVNEQVHLYDSFKGKFIDHAAVLAKWGVVPSKVRDLLALAGDNADNIPGVPGIGPKTAATLLAEYGDLARVLNNAAKVKQKKRREMLLAHQEEARLSYYLVTLREDVPLPCGLQDLANPQANKAAMFAFCQQFELTRLAQQYQSSEVAKPEKKAHCLYHEVVDATAVQALMQTLKGQVFGFYVFSQSDTPQALAFATEAEAWQISLQHGLDAVYVLAEVAELLMLATDVFVFDIKQQQALCVKTPLCFQQNIWDTMLLAYCLYPAKYAPTLKNIAQDYLGVQCLDPDKVLGKGRKRKSSADMSTAELLPLLAETAWLSLRLGQQLKESLHAQKRLRRYQEIEQPLMHVLSAMQHTGAKLDEQMLAKLSAKFLKRIAQLEKDIQDLAACNFNVHSPAQLGDVLFNRLALPGGKKTKTGAWSTAQEVLEKLSEEHVIVQHTIELRQLSKLNSTYANALPKLCDAQHRVHTSFNQAITSTGRLSSSEPNLQNIPIRTLEGREIRKAFVADQAKLLLAADYSQIELRLMAHYSQDEALLAAFQQGLDIHTATAASIHHLALADVSGEQRRAAKVVNFGILYGMSAFGLAKQLKVSRTEAQQFIDAYFARYPKVQDFMDRTLEEAREQGYVETLCGHRVYVPDINAKNKILQKYAQRTAINAPLQGSAADIIKIAMVNLHKKLQLKPQQAQLILQVHDELVLEVASEHLEATKQLVQQEMEQAIALSVPLIVDIGTGSTWFEAHQL